MAGPDQAISDHDRLVEIHTIVKSQKEEVDDHEQRIRRLERYMWLMVGISAGAGSAIGSLAGEVIG